MSCMKCGKATEESRTFCQGCLAVMEQYPVKSGTKVVIPPQRTPSRANRLQRKQRTADEVMTSQRKLIGHLVRVIVALTLLLAVSTGIIVWRLHQERNMAPLGSNYSTVEDTTATQNVFVSRETFPIG